MDCDNNCFVRCSRHGAVQATLSQRGEYYHSCTVWDPRFISKVLTPAGLGHTCNVGFVFCREHLPRRRLTVGAASCNNLNNTVTGSNNDSSFSSPASITPMAASPQTQRQAASVILSSTVSAGDIAENINTSVDFMMSAYLSPDASPASQRSLTDGQQRLIDAFNDLIDSLYM